MRFVSPRTARSTSSSVPAIAKSTRAASTSGSGPRMRVMARTAGHNPQAVGVRSGAAPGGHRLVHALRHSSPASSLKELPAPVRPDRGRGGRGVERAAMPPQSTALAATLGTESVVFPTRPRRLHGGPRRVRRPATSCPGRPMSDRGCIAGPFICLARPNGSPPQSPRTPRTSPRRG